MSVATNRLQHARLKSGESCSCNPMVTLSNHQFKTRGEVCKRSGSELTHSMSRSTRAAAAKHQKISSRTAFEPASLAFSCSRPVARIFATMIQDHDDFMMQVSRPIQRLLIPIKLASSEVPIPKLDSEFSSEKKPRGNYNSTLNPHLRVPNLFTRL
ncbi:hypothetical protein CROQUDRAFT_89638 [Cronartium quercuum f. sp. fusiforme G11]|uniref:Uncharacterized protein n=1 Tax=Cronartium quercuum f. sp. fusiforme G11 TaxID=708437 RepID=A0A9P6NT70_9BASI|nr:hypothetical protein CROQUDRAFT_89638 [Cronartium quercuum f. sp. fusiforme G11]